MSDENVKPEVAEETAPVAPVEYQETPIEPKNPALKRISEKLKQAGLNFHPGKILAELDKEAERQFAEICKDHLKGQSIKAIIEIQGEVYGWMEAEDQRFAAFRAVNQEKALDNAGAAPVFTPIEGEKSDESVHASEPKLEDPLEPKEPLNLNSSHIPVETELPKNEGKKKGKKK